MSSILVGWSQISFTPDRPVFNGGQIYPRVAEYVHDPLMATALAIDNGIDQAVLVSLDIMCVPPESITGAIREKLKDLDGFDPACLSISATHTHNSIQSGPWLFDQSSLDFIGEEKLGLPALPEHFMQGAELDQFIIDRVVQVVREAWTSRKPGGISTMSDYAAVAFNRRPMFRNENGESTQMYGDCSLPEFSHFEGTSDHSADMIYTFDCDNRLTGIAVCIPCPSQVFELHSFLTADYWHYTRLALREKFGNIFILPLCGAAGDQNPLDLVRISKDNHAALAAWSAQAGPVFRNFDMADVCRDIADRISEAVCRGYRKAVNQIETQPVFRHVAKTIQLPIRKVSEQDFSDAKAFLEQEKAAFDANHQMQGVDLVRIFEPMGVYARYVQQNKCDVVDVSLHYWRIGSAMMVSCPFELFVDYAFQIKARVPARQMIVVQMTDNYLDYLPTEQALRGGSYSSAPASTTCGPDSGKKMTEVMIAELERLWAEE